MNKGTHEKKDGGGPPVFRFKARLFRDPDTGKTGSGMLVNVPEVVKLPSRGITKVEGTINGHPFRAALEPNKSGSYCLRVNKAMRKGADADVGDMVKLVILGPEPEPAVPADLRVALAASHEAKAFWKDLTPTCRLDWIRWIVSVRKPETRARRIKRTVESLSSGKRRPCCMNIYDFMMRRIPTKWSRPKGL